MHTHSHLFRSCSWLATLLLTAAATAQAAGNPEADLRSKSIDARLAAIDALAGSGRADLDKLLLPLLKDRDWEIQERTAMALGRARCQPALRALIDLAVDGDIVRIRQAAATAAASVDAAEAATGLWRLSKGKKQVAALEALAHGNRRQAALPEADKLEKLRKDEDPMVREAAAAAWLECAADRTQALRTLLTEPSLIVRCRALDAVSEAPRPADLAPLQELLAGGKQNDVVERRLVRALAAVLAEGSEDLAGRAASTLEAAGTGGFTLARRARIVALLARGERPVLDKRQAVDALSQPLGAADAAARAAADKALREIGGDDALETALAMFPREPDPRGQLQLVETVAALRPLTTPEAVAWFTAIAVGRADDSVRERAIVLLGQPGIQGAAESLTGLLGAPQWTLACCAAVSLGKTHDDAAFDPLSGMLRHADWARRGAAVVGLMHWSRAAAVEPLLGMLGDDHPVVAGAAHAALQNLSRQYDVPAKEKAWRTWWARHIDKHAFVDRAESIDKRKKFGYAVSDTEIYADLDVVVFTSRGDHIEQLLERLKIAHRKTEATKIPQAGIHPEAIFVSNCTGEIGPDDQMPLAWFVRTGGSLFGSCWALSKTIAVVHPGVMDKANTRGEVLDDVRALPCRRDSPLLNGVFPPAVVPIYHLEGAHLIQVSDTERCEVLIDSPDAAERHGCGNLAAWFRSGHGVLFDSANHFDLQGLATAKDLATDVERQAYAVDHMGLSLETWRATRTAAHWKQAGKVGKSVPDLSAFRLLTNFVRSKRANEY